MTGFSIQTPGSRPALLMCAPKYFSVEYIINPWMQDNVGKSHLAEAQRQWQALYEALCAEAEVHLVAPQPGQPDFVFTANAALVEGTRAVISRFRSKERQGEEPHYRAWFTAAGYQIAEWPAEVSFEGAGDGLFDRGQPLLWLGHGFRSDPRAYALLSTFTDREVVLLELVDPRFYHVDTCLCPLAGGFLLYYPPAFSPESQAEIVRRVPPERRIVASEVDALGFACNAVDLGGKVFLNRCSDELRAQLAAAGLEARVFPLDEFLKAGGAAKCLTLKLMEP